VWESGTRWVNSRKTSETEGVEEGKKREAFLNNQPEEGDIRGKIRSKSPKKKFDREKKGKEFQKMSGKGNYTIEGGSLTE